MIDEYQIIQAAKEINAADTKWDDPAWIEGELQKHVDEIAQLRQSKDPHLLAELTDWQILLELAKMANMPISDWEGQVDQSKPDWPQDVTPTNRIPIRKAKFLHYASYDK